MRASFLSGVLWTFNTTNLTTNNNARSDVDQKHILRVRALYGPDGFRPDDKDSQGRLYVASTGLYVGSRFQYNGD